MFTLVKTSWLLIIPDDTVEEEEEEDVDRPREAGSGVETDSIDAVPLLNDPHDNVSTGIGHHIQASHGFLASKFN